MVRQTSRQLVHDASSPTVLWQAYSGRTARPSIAKMPAANKRQGVCDRELDSSAPNSAPHYHLGIELLAIVARLGLALVMTVGFAAGLSLNNGMNLASPFFVKVCGRVFLWALALVSCVTSRSK